MRDSATRAGSASPVLPGQLCFPARNSPVSPYPALCQAVILAAGRGERLRPLTDHTPKPLIEVGGKPLLDHHLAALVAAGFSRCVVNVAHLGAQIEAHLADQRRFAIEIVVSREPPGALETGGGLKQALGLLEPGPFLVLNGDILCDFDLRSLAGRPHGLAHLVLVPNPPANPGGDFCLHGEAVSNAPAPRLTFSGIGVYQPALFDDAPAEARFPLAPLLRRAADRGQVSGEAHHGRWFDIGTPERLAVARAATMSGNPDH